MTDHPFMLDIVLLLILLPILEAIILWRNYRVFSPMTIFCAGMIVLYAMPYVTHFYIQYNRRLGRLDYEQFRLAFNTLRVFLYTFAAVSIPAMLRLRKKATAIIAPERYMLQKRLARVFVFYIMILILYLGVGVGFSPAKMLERAIHPRSYTYIKVGLGPLTHLYSGMKFVLIALAAMWVCANRKSIGAWLIFLIAAVVTSLGGSKSSIVLPFIVLVVTWQQYSWRMGNPLKKLWHTILASSGAILLVVAGFAFITTSESETTALSTSIRRIPGYHKEAYYLPLIIDHFPWRIEYPLNAIGDTFITPVPRALWTSKPARLGLWNRYFRREFEPNTLYYHTSTFGCLAESHMLFGRLGPFLYGILWAFVVYKLYSYMISSSSILKSYFVGVIAFWMYLLLRTGFIGTNLWIMVIYFGMGWWFLRRLELKPDNPTGMLYDESEYSMVESRDLSYRQ